MSELVPACPPNTSGSTTRVRRPSDAAETAAASPAGPALLREALRRHLDRLASEGDERRWADEPLDSGERALGEITEWGPAEDWSDWAVDATR